MQKFIVWKFDKVYQETPICNIENNCNLKPKTKLRFVLHSLILFELILDSAIIFYLEGTW